MSSLRFLSIVPFLAKSAIKFASIIACKVFYPNSVWLQTWNPYVVWKYAFFQKILNVNGARLIDWPVHFTSMVSGNVRVGTMCSPGFMPGAYINGMNGVELGDNVFIGPGVKIISANHDHENYAKHELFGEIKLKIGSNTWIGANVVILPKASIGDNCIIGAGAVVTKSIPSNSIAAGNPARVLSGKRDYQACK